MTKIITWNVNGIRACSQKGLWGYLEKENPDLFCLQETKAHPDQLEAHFHSPLNRKSYWSSALKRGYSGVVTYAREEPLQIEYGIGIRKFDSEGRFVITEHPQFRLYNVYFPNGGSGEERHQFKQDFLKRFTKHLLQQLNQGREVIVVGDYNVAYLEQDVYDPTKLSSQSGFLPEERQWFDEFLRGGFVDAFRLLHANESHRYTWWSYQERARVTNRGWRIDHICVSKRLAQKVLKAEIHDDVEGSDHCPVVVELDL